MSALAVALVFHPGLVAAYVANLEWSWTSAPAGDPFPTYINVLMTPAIADLDDDGIPDVVFAATDATSAVLVASAVLRAVRGTDGQDLFAISSPLINGTSSLAVGDIDGDGRPEIIAANASGDKLIAFEHDGALKWTSATLEAITWGGPSLADFDDDGVPEIVIGRQLLQASDGALLWVGTGAKGSDTIGPLSIVADLDVDGTPEVVAGRTAYQADGTQLWDNLLVSDGRTAVADFDADDKPEVVVVGNNNVWLLEGETGTVKWGPVAIPGAGRGGSPTVADFDDDGSPEIGVAGQARYAMLDADGTVVWNVAIQDPGSSRAGSASFDFDADGVDEVAYRDEIALHIFRGTDGVSLLNVPLSSCAYHEYPVIADVDADGGAEVIVSANPGCNSGTDAGIFVYSDNGGSWAGTREVWNQHSYHITNVADDAAIPSPERHHFLHPVAAPYNSFRHNRRVCAGADGDGFCADIDCDDFAGAVFPGAPQICDGLNNDCDHASWPALANTNEDDFDGDTFTGCTGDCDDTDSDVFAGAPEINDGVDNQCPGDDGSGLVDELSGGGGFQNLADISEYSWTAQSGALQYQVARAGSPTFSTGCTTFATTSPVLNDPLVPALLKALYYVVRPLAPLVGSWGESSAQVERIIICGSEAICDNSVDDDGDGLADCLDDDCDGLSGCELGTELTCNDTLDNDADGFTDCADSDCGMASGCESMGEMTCNDVFDNDGDGLIDCADPNCGMFPGCELMGEMTCDDSFDNDGDGLIDCADPNCAMAPGC